MNIRIDYMTSQRVTQMGEFKYGKPEIVAFNWWRQIKRETHNAKLEKVILDSEKDITEAVKALDNAPLPPDNLPF